MKIQFAFSPALVKFSSRYPFGQEPYETDASFEERLAAHDRQRGRAIHRKQSRHPYPSAKGPYDTDASFEDKCNAYYQELGYRERMQSEQ